jgi:serum/glucocorticoid-regulated kinase 2
MSYVNFIPLYLCSANVEKVDALDTKNFATEFTEEAPTDSYVDGPMLSSTMQQQFTGWSYNRPVAGLGDAGGSIRDPSVIGGVQDR